MQRDAARSLFVALLCVVAIALAAATLTTPVDSGGGSGGVVGSDTESDSSGSDVDRRDGERGVADQGTPVPNVCLPWLLDPAVVLGLLLVAALAAVTLVRRYGAFAGASALVGALPLVLLWQYLVGGCDVDTSSSTIPGAVGSPNVTRIEEVVGGGSGTGTGAATPEIPLVLAFVVGVVLLVGLAVLLGSREASSSDETVDAPADVGAVGRAAGRAADRIESSGADVTNEVFRAWREMTTSLDVDRPAATTPAEFAAAATDAGMDPDDVGELTDLFEAVRYGGAAATAERESRAVDALRRIEAAYAATDDTSAEGDR